MSVQAIVVVVKVNRIFLKSGASAQIFVCLSVRILRIYSASQILRRSGQRINRKIRRANTTNELEFIGQRVFCAGIRRSNANPLKKYITGVVWNAVWIYTSLSFSGWNCFLFVLFGKP